jgi:hypothetical protein
MGPLENEPLRTHRTLVWSTPTTRLQMGDLKASAAPVTTAVCSPCRACRGSTGDRQSRGSGYRCQPASASSSPKRALANGLFNERERFFGFSGGFSHLGAALRPSTYLLGLQYATWLAQGSAASCSLCSAVMISSRCARSAASARISASRDLKALAQSDGHGPQSRGRAPPYCGRHRPLDTPDRGCRSLVGADDGRKLGTFSPL